MNLTDDQKFLLATVVKVINDASKLGTSETKILMDNGVVLHISAISPNLQDPVNE